MALHRIISFLSIVLAMSVSLRAQDTIRNATFSVEGTCLDKETKVVISGVSVEMVGTDGSSYTAITDSTGYFQFLSLRENTTYAIRACKEDYLVVKDQVVVGLHQESTRHIKEYYFSTNPPTICRWMYLLYEVHQIDDITAKSDSAEIEYLVELLADNPTIVLELTGYRLDIEALTMGIQRSSWLKKQLIDRGVDPERLICADKGLFHGSTFTKGSLQVEALMMPRVVAWDFVPR